MQAAGRRPRSKDQKRGLNRQPEAGKSIRLGRVFGTWTRDLIPPERNRTSTAPYQATQSTLKTPRVYIRPLEGYNSHSSI